MLCVDWFARKKLQLVEGIEALCACAKLWDTRRLYPGTVRERPLGLKVFSFPPPLFLKLKKKVTSPMLNHLLLCV